jgi:molybdate transport system ATP-binding protein
MSLSVTLSHAFEGFTLEASFEAPPGVTALFGRSGAGKTTLVNAVAGLVRPNAGRVAVDDWTLFDTDKRLWLAPHKRRIGYVFQEGRLFPHLSVRQNLLYGRWFAPGNDGARYDHVVDLLGLGTLLERRPGTLSGGEKQRVAIGRALLSDPKLLLMDEPLAALDEARKAEIMPYLERLRDETRTPILYVSHSVAEVARLATTVVALSEGRVVRAGPTAEVLSDPDAAPMLGVRDAGAVLWGRVRAHHPDGLTELQVSAGPLLLPQINAPVGSEVRIRIEARDVILALDRPQGLSALNILAAKVTALRPGHGPGMVVQLRVGQDLILARITRRSAEALGVAPGLSCYAIMKTVAVAPGNVGTGAP